MQITNAKYTTDSYTGENAYIKTTIDDQEMFVPLDPDNRHYQAIQEWVAEGNKIEDAD